MIAVHSEKVLKIIAKFSNPITDFRTKALDKLKSIDQAQFAPHPEDKNYLNRIIHYFQNDDIIVGEEVVLETIKNDLFALKTENTDLKNEIVKALNYKGLRSTFYPKYFQELDVKSCVYCNSQLTIVARKDTNGNLSAKFQVDHYYPKDDFPFLSISLFNLYPSCATCNNLKKKKEVDFNLYSRNINETLNSRFKFKLSPSSKIKYLTSKDSSDIEILFKDNKNKNKIFNDTFHIEGIYETQKDLIEELIIKSQIYNDSYLKSLNNSFSKLSLNPSLFKRTIVGNYVDERDIHKRPMSKVVMDIARDLGLIEDSSKTI